jgi:hypothetical protein
MNDRRPLTENQQRKKARAIKALVALASLYTENSGLMQELADGISRKLSRVEIDQLTTLINTRDWGKGYPKI